MEKDWKSCETDKIGHSESFCATSMGKDWKNCKSEPLRWEKIGKVEKAKLAIPSHSEPLRWEKIGKVENRAKLAILSHSEPLWWEKIGKVVTQTKSNFSGGGGTSSRMTMSC